VGLACLVETRETWGVGVLEVAGVGTDVGGSLREEVVRGEDEECAGEEGASEDGAVPCEDGAGEGRDGDVEDARGERLVRGDERLDAGYRK
jgi:hypothetical protein